MFAGMVRFGFLYFEERTTKIQPTSYNRQKEVKKFDCGYWLFFFEQSPTQHILFKTNILTRLQKSSSCKLHFSVKLTVKDLK